MMIVVAKRSRTRIMLLTLLLTLLLAGILLVSGHSIVYTVGVCLIVHACRMLCKMQEGD